MSYFKSKDLGVINASPTGMGILNNSGATAYLIIGQNIIGAPKT